MPVGSASWSFTQDDFDALTQTLQRFLYDSNARCALLVVVLLRSRVLSCRPGNQRCALQ